MNLHQFVVVTKDSPFNHTREDITTEEESGEIVIENVKTENTKTICHFQEYFPDGTSAKKMFFLEDLPQDIQEKAMELFNAIVPFAQNLE